MSNKEWIKTDMCMWNENKRKDAEGDIKEIIWNNKMQIWYFEQQKITINERMKWKIELICVVEIWSIGGEFNWTSAPQMKWFGCELISGIKIILS